MEMEKEERATWIKFYDCAIRAILNTASYEDIHYGEPGKRLKEYHQKRRELMDMKKLIEIDENEGLEKLMGEVVTLMCMNYFYTGKLTGVNEKCVKLENPSIVYETGEWSKKDWNDVQKLPCKELYVMVASIESYGVLK